VPEAGGQPAGRSEQPPEPQGRFAGIPYDWRKPTAARIAARWWNPDDHRLFTPKSYGWGYVLNFYWLIHPVRYFRSRS
jgi:hypothetical protein